MHNNNCLHLFYSYKAQKLNLWHLIKSECNATHRSAQLFYHHIGYSRVLLGCQFVKSRLWHIHAFFKALLQYLHKINIYGQRPTHFILWHRWSAPHPVLGVCDKNNLLSRIIVTCVTCVINDITQKISIFCCIFWLFIYSSMISK